MNRYVFQYSDNANPETGEGNWHTLSETSVSVKKTIANGIFSLSRKRFQEQLEKGRKFRVLTYELTLIDTVEVE